MLIARRATNVSDIAMSRDIFRGYKKEEGHELRKADVTGQTFIEQARKAREMLRSMDPETVKQVIEFHNGLNFFQALALAQREGKLIVPNYVHDGILTKTDDITFLEQNYPVWTGTLVIYEKPDKPFSEQVIYSWEHNEVRYSVSFKVPKQFQGKTNCALVIEHPDFELLNLGNNRYGIKVADERSVHLIKSFPKKHGLRMPHTETGIPHGRKVKESSDARYLCRFINSSYLGLLRRGYVGFYVYDWRRDIVFGGLPSERRGVGLVSLAVEPEKSDLK